jgi:hypothetical protein
MIDGEGDNGGSSEIDDSGSGLSYFDELGVPPVIEDTNTDSSVGEDQTLNTEDKIPPAWGKLFEVLPEQFQKHPVVRDTLKGWDDNFAKVQSDYAPYKPLLENKISYEDIQNSIELTRLINANPRYVFDELGKRYGFAPEQGQQQVEDQELEEEEDNAPNLLELENNPTLKAMQDQLNTFQQMFAAQEQAKQDAAIQETAKAEIQNEWNQLYTQLRIPEGKDLPQNVKNEIIRRSVAIGDETGNYSLKAGYDQYAEFVNFVRNTRASNTAPTVMPGNGALPSTKKNIGQMDEDERINHIAAFAKSLAEGNGS